MITRVTQVITDASAGRCFDASERTSASVSRALASIRSVNLPPSQVANRVSSIAPVTSSTISRPLLRAHVAISCRYLRIRFEDMAFHHGCPTADEYSHAAERGRAAALDPDSEGPGCEPASAPYCLRRR